MKKQIHILQGFIILLTIIISILLLIKFIYEIKHEFIDTTYMWNINLKNIKVKDGSQKGTISLKDNILNLDVTLNKEEEYYEFTFDTCNEGTLDAKIKDIQLIVDNPQNILKYSLSYEDQTPINKGDILYSKESNTILIKITYPKQTNKIYDKLNLKLSLYIEYTALY